MIDGEPGATADTSTHSIVFASSVGQVKYDAESDRLMFYRDHTLLLDVERALVAPQLATALGLRQPMDLGAKPAKR